jgi:hypothetical protein
MNRRWLYGGLAVVAGVGLARLVHRGPKITPGGATRLLLVGGAFAAGLAPPMRALATEQKVPFDAVVVPDTGKPLRTDEWVTRPELLSKLAAFKATLVAVALDAPSATRADRAKQAAALKGLLAAIRAAGADVVWIGPPVPPTDALQKRPPSPQYFPTGTSLKLPRGPDGVQPTVAGYAGWAGALWQWLS